MNNMNEQGYTPQNDGYNSQPQQPQNYGQQPYGQQPYGQQMPMAKPNNNLILAIFTTLCCCLPFGIVAIIMASKVDGYYNTGQHQAAQKAADDAKKWSLIGIIVGVVVWIIYMAVYGLAIFASLQQ